MRKIYAVLLSLFLLFVLNSVSKAQVSTYVFTPSSSTYTALSGTTTSTATGDDGTQNVPIGFNFTLGSATYTNAIISTNGAIKLAADGTTGFGTSWTNNLSNTYNAAIIAPLWDDNNAAGGSVVYVTSGTAPNRTFSVEWVNIHISGGGSSASPTGTFQLTLTEGTNAITFKYGTINTISGATMSVGLNDLVSFLSVTPAATATASSGTANNAIATAGNLPSGTTYNFIAPPPCVPGSLAGGTTTSSAAPVCTGISFTLSVTGASFGSGLTYQWESSPDGTTWTNVAAATGMNLTTTQTAATYYRRKMTCSGTDAYSTSLQVGLNPPTACYCTPPASSCALDDVILNVTLGTLNNTTACSATNGYSNFTVGQPVPSMNQSVTYPISVEVGPGGTEYVAVWIDYNQNGTFEASEFTAIGTGNGSVVNGTITIPTTATLGNTRMRVRTRFNTALTGADACLGYSFGETEDYTVTIAPAPPCVTPSGVTISNIALAAATINWTAPTPAPGVGYEYEVRTSGAAGSGATGLAASGSVAVGTNTANVSGLTTNTQYTVYVRSVCTAGTLYSAWSTGVIFRTLCDVQNTFPFTETFEVSSTTRSCWKVNDYVNGNKDWTYGAGAGNGGPVTTAHGGTVNAQFFGNGTASTTKLVSPAFNLSGMTTGADLVFWYANANWLGDQNELRVYYKTSAAGTWTLLPGAVYTSNVGAWTEVEIPNLPNLSSEYYIAFEGSEFFGWGVAIDDVTIKAAPTCRKPTLVSAISTLPTTASVSFTSPGNSFIVEYGAPGFTPGTANTAGTGGTVVFGSVSPILVTGLAAGTAYDIYVRQICVPGVDFSENVKTTVTTLCPATNIPYLQNFETATPPGFPTCTSMQDVNGNSGPDPNLTGGRWVTFTGTSNQTYVSPTRSMRYLYDAANLSRGADDWFFIQGLNLTAGTTYRLKFFYKGSDGPTWTERMEVKYGTSAQASAMTNTIYSNTNINTALANPWDSARADFTPATTGVYYLGFHATSLPDQAFLYIDDISVRISPVVDAGVTGLKNALPICPTTNTVMTAIVRNFNLTTLNFATHPVTVTASLTGAGTATLTTTLNTGTLAPGATMEVPLPPYSFVTGTYNVSVKTSSPFDPETGNDTYTTSVFVNPTPPAAVFTPADPRTCALISTQFTPPPAPIVISSGTIAVAIPDNSATGASHTLAVSGVPASPIANISITLNVTHTWVNDLTLNLTAPNGKVLNLFNRKGGFAQANITNAVISSTSTAVIPAAGAPFTGTWAADAALGVGTTTYTSDVSNFADLIGTMNGNWILSARDHVGLDVGTITSWSISITTGVPNPVVTWTPTTSLFTDAGGTVPYVGGTNAFSVYANPAATTTYTVTSTSAAGCTNSSTVTVRPLVDVTALPARICISDEVVPLNATPAGGTWSGIGVSGTSFIPPATAIGSYPLTYRYTNANNCTSVTSVVATVVDCPERLRLLRDSAVILYPNPNTGIFNIRMNSVLYNKLTMRVYTTSGMLAYTRELTGLAYGRVVPMDLTHLPAGSYMVQFYYPGGVRTSDKVFQVVIGR